jgi:hypothetical protein
MSYIRKLPSRKWHATVRGPDGRKHTKTDRLKSVVDTWAKQQEATPRGERRDPRAGTSGSASGGPRYAAAHAGKASAARNASLWLVHCAPKWAGWRRAQQGSGVVVAPSGRRRRQTVSQLVCEECGYAGTVKLEDDQGRRSPSRTIRRLWTSPACAWYVAIACRSRTQRLVAHERRTTW